MSDQTQSAIIVTAIARWTTIPGRTVSASCVEIAFRRRAEQANEELFIEEICIEPPRAWKPGTVFIGHDAGRLNELKAGSTIVNGSRSTTWEVSQRVTRDTWALIFSNTKPETALPNDFGLDVAILLEKNKCGIDWKLDG